MNRSMMVGMFALGLLPVAGCFSDFNGAGPSDLGRAEDVIDLPPMWDTPPSQDLSDVPDLPPMLDTPPSQDLSDVPDLPPMLDTPPSQDLSDVPDLPPMLDTPPSQDLSDVPDVPPAEDVADLPNDDGAIFENLVLDPASLTFFVLPINSIRAAVSGYAPASRTCVTIVWDYSNTGRDVVPWCDESGPGFPYVNIVRDTDGPCGTWDYGSGVTTIAATGCVQFAALEIGASDLVDVVLTLDVPGWGKVIVEADNRATYDPQPVSLGLKYIGKTPGNVFIQTGDDYGLPSWIQVLGADGNARLLFDRCDVPSCDAPGGGVCGIAFHSVRNVTGGADRGQAWLTWDGKFRVLNAGGTCRDAIVSPPGEYTLRACFGVEIVDVVNGTGPDVLDPTCYDVPFTLPHDTQVSVDMDFSG